MVDVSLLDTTSVPLVEVPGAQESLLKRMCRWVPLGGLAEKHQSWREALSHRQGGAEVRSGTGTSRQI